MLKWTPTYPSLPPWMLLPSRSILQRMSSSWHSLILMVASSSASGCRAMHFPAVWPTGFRCGWAWRPAAVHAIGHRCSTRRDTRFACYLAATQPRTGIGSAPDLSAGGRGAARPQQGRRGAGKQARTAAVGNDSDGKSFDGDHVSVVFVAH